MRKQYDVAAFIWPAYTGDEPRTRMFWPEGYGEWQSVKNAKKNGADKPDGYVWDRKPLWGYVNEADPAVMEMEIAQAYEHGVNVFIYDWYWYDDRPFLEQCLDNGYLKAKNNDLVKFYLMWANHHATQMWNIELSDELPNDIIWRGDGYVLVRESDRTQEGHENDLGYQELLIIHSDEELYDGKLLY